MPHACSCAIYTGEFATLASFASCLCSRTFCRAPASDRGRTRLEDQWRLDFDYTIRANRRYCIPPEPLPDPFMHHLLATPGGKDKIRNGRNRILQRNDPLPGRFPRPQTRKHVIAAGDLDQLGHPTDSGDKRIVPLLEIDLWPSLRRALPRNLWLAFPPCLLLLPARRGFESWRRFRRCPAG
jgi:hypothetical protein